MVPDDAKNPFSYVPDDTDVSQLDITAPMDNIGNGSGKRLIISLDVAATSAVYNLEVCGSFTISSKLSNWPVQAYLEMTDFPNLLVSTIGTFTLTDSEDCHDT